MNRSIAHRTTAGLLAGVFLLAGSVSAYGLHSCPHHDHGDRGDAAAQQARAPAPDHGSHLDASGSRDERPASGPCTCVGSCHGSAATPVVADGPERPSPDLFGVELHVSTPAHRAPSGDPTSFLVPYPHGPPLIG